VCKLPSMPTVEEARVLVELYRDLLYPAVRDHTPSNEGPAHRVVMGAMFPLDYPGDLDELPVVERAGHAYRLLAGCARCMARYLGERGQFATANDVVALAFGPPDPAPTVVVFGPEIVVLRAGRTAHECADHHKAYYAAEYRRVVPQLGPELAAASAAKGAVVVTSDTLPDVVDALGTHGAVREIDAETYAAALPIATIAAAFGPRVPAVNAPRAGRVEVLFIYPAACGVVVASTERAPAQA